MSRSEARPAAAVAAGDALDTQLTIVLERFDYTRVGTTLGVLQVLARVPAGATAPSAAELIVYQRAERPTSFAAQTLRVEARLLPGGGTQTLWRALFTVPLAVVEQAGVVYGLTGGGATGDALILPVPTLRHAGPAGLQLIPADELGRPGVPLRQAVAVATAVAVTASSTPAMALATGISHGWGGPSATRAASLTASAHSAAPTHSAASAQSAAPTSSAAPSTAATSPSRPAPARPPVSRVRAPATAPSATRAQSSAPTRATGATRTATHGATAPAPTCTPGTDGLTAAASTRPGAGSCTAVSTRPARRRVVEGLTSHPKGTHAHPGSATAPASTSTTSGPASTPGASAPVAGSSGGVAAGTVTTPGTGTTPTATGATPAGTATTPAATTPTTSTATTPTPTPAGSTTSGSKPTPAPAVHRARPEPTSHPAHSVSPVHVGPGVPGAAPVLGGLNGRPPVALSGTSTGTPTLSANPPGFSGPRSWTGTVTNDPALSGALGDLSNLLANGDTPPGFLVPVYMEAGARYHVPWEVLAAINAVETDYGRNLNTSSAGAIGWMQFEPATWKEWGLAADGHSVPNPYDPRDAIFSAARYLAAAGAAKDIWGAVYAYNHASWYVDMVMTRARAIAANVRPERESIRRGVVSLDFATYSRRHPTVRFRGGLLSHFVRLVAAANMVSAANFPYVWGGGHEQPARFGPFDCSGSVSYVMQQAGYRVPTSVSGNIGSWGFPKGPGRVTIFYNPTHTFMRIGDRYFGTSGFARPGGGAGWFSTDRLPAAYLANFSEVHVPALGTNAFARRSRYRVATHRRHRRQIVPFSSSAPTILSQLRPLPAFAHAVKFAL